MQNIIERCVMPYNVSNRVNIKDKFYLFVPLMSKSTDGGSVEPPSSGNYVRFTDYATEDKAGLITTKIKYGLSLGANGELSTYQATAYDIDKKLNLYAPITPYRLDYAIKVGVTTNTNALTDKEKENACDWLGAGTKRQVDIMAATLEQSEILTVDEITSKFNSRVTANGRNALNGSKVEVKKVEGDTVSSTNLLSFPYYSGGVGPHERQGITFDVKEDGSVHVHGTATGDDASFIFARNDNQMPFSFLQAEINYKIGGNGEGINTTLQGSSTIRFSTESTTEILYNYAVYAYFINIPKGTIVNTTFYPYINYGHGGFDRPLGGKLVNASFMGIECKARENLITVSTEGSTENNGITWSWNKDGSVTVTGTSNSSGSTRVFSMLGFKVEGEKYTVGESSDTVYAYLKTAQGSLTTIWSSDNSDISLDDYTEYGFYIPPNTTVNTIIYPYVAQGSIKGYPPMSNKGVKSTWSFPKTSLPLGTTLDFENRKKTNTYGEYTFKGETGANEIWVKVGSDPVVNNRITYYFNNTIGIIKSSWGNGEYAKAVCDRYPAVYSKTEDDALTGDSGIHLRFGGTGSNMYIIIPTSIIPDDGIPNSQAANPAIRALTKGMTIRYPTTAENTDWHETKDFTSVQISAGNSYEAYYEGTETIRDNDGAEEGTKPTVTAEYVVVNKIGDET